MLLSYKIFDLIKETCCQNLEKVPVFMIWGNGASEKAWTFTAKDKMPILILSAMSIINGTI